MGKGWFGLWREENGRNEKESIHQNMPYEMKMCHVSAFM